MEIVVAIEKKREIEKERWSIKMGGGGVWLVGSRFASKESKTRDFESQSIKLLAFRRAVAVAAFRLVLSSSSLPPIVLVTFLYIFSLFYPFIFISVCFILYFISFLFTFFIFPSLFLFFTIFYFLLYPFLVSFLCYPVLSLYFTIFSLLLFFVSFYYRQKTNQKWSVLCRNRTIL